MKGIGGYPQIAGILLTLCYAALLYLLVFLGSDVSLVAGLFLYPLGLGLATQALTDPRIQKTAGRIYLRSLLAVAVLCAILLAMAMETIICVVMAVPIVLPMMFVGVLTGRVLMWALLRRLNRTTMQACALLLPLLPVMIGIDVTWPARNYVVETAMVINAPVARVWDNTVSIPMIADEERRWSISHNVLGIPRPVDAVMVGDIRHLRWSDGVEFQEHVTARRDHDWLEWQFVFHDPYIYPEGPELFLTRGSYQLQALDSGRMHYMLQTPLDGYLAWWGQLMLNDFHAGVLHVIKGRSEYG